MVSERTTANRISVNTAEQDDCIESVTVFQGNRAEVKRRITLELKQGQNHIDIERLPTCVNENSIRVEGTGNAIIFDVVYHRPTSSWGGPSYASNSPEYLAVAECRRALDVLRKEREVVKQQSSYLESYGKTLDSKNMNIGDVERFLDLFAPRQMAIVKHIQELDVQIIQAEKAHDDAQAKTRADPRDANRSTKVTVTVLADVDGQADLLLTYAVSNASWTPMYDVRASIAKSSDEPSKVALHYRASITQTTGENWPNVALTLSTASPQLGSDVPDLKAWRIGFPVPPQSRQIANYTAALTSYDAAYAPASPAYSPTSPYFSPAPIGVQYPGQSIMAYRPTQVVGAGVLSASSSISGRSDIPSDEGSHKVVIAVLDLEAEPEWVCMPREKESVFLRCKVVNSSEFTLLPGDASVFMDNNFVSKSRIEHVSPNDSFKTSLGVDSALRVSYPPARTLNRTINRSSFFLGNNPGQSVAAHSQRITIRNTRAASVTALRVFDHVPVSTDAGIKVEVLSPNSLGLVGQVGQPGNEEMDESKGKERPWTSVKTGVKARWATLDVGGEGTVEWECQVQPNEEVGLDLAWEVSAPVGQKWTDI